VTPGSDALEGATPEAAEAQGEARERGAAACDRPGPLPSPEPVSSSAPAEQTGLVVRERRSALFKPPSRATFPPVGMAANGQVESFRELRTQLTLRAAGAGLTTFTTLVVPVTEGSGASFVARNLAAAFTLQQRLALIVDCNVGKAGQHEGLGADDGAEGLFDYLLRPSEVPIERLIRPTPLPGLHVIPAGRAGAIAGGSAREPFSSGPMRTLLARLRDEPCHVFLDGPPVEGSPDARILADLADFVVLVVGYGRTPATAVTRAAAVFERRNFAGVVFNEAAAARSAASPERPGR
jgi:Mrp family chromosome partitioning ATPase